LTVERTSRIRWLLIFWLFVLSAVAYLDRVNISIAGTLLASEFHLSKIQLGWIFSAFLAGYALFQTPGGRLADKLGARRVLALAVLWWGVFSAHRRRPRRIPLRVIRVHGAAVHIGRGRSRHVPRIQSIRRSLDSLLRARPRQRPHFLRRWSWRWIRTAAHHLHHAAPRLAHFIPRLRGSRPDRRFSLYLLARNTPEEHSRVSPNELAKIKAGLPESHPAEIPKLVPWRLMLRSKEVLAITISYFTYGYVAWIFFSWFYIYLLGSARAQSQSQRRVLDGCRHRDGDMFIAGRIIE